MKRFTIGLLLLFVIAFTFTCYGQDDEYWSWGVKKFTPEEQEEYNQQWNEINRIQDSENYTDSYYSYAILGARTSAAELTLGYTKVGADTWKYYVADNIDGYLWLENNVVITEGFVFHDIDPNLTHDVVADMVTDLFENGHIRKQTKCTNGYSSICSNLKKNMGNLISFPVTVFKTDLSYVQCYLTQSKVFSNGKENQFFYVCALGS